MYTQNPTTSNSWDRQPFLTTVRTGKPDMIMQWREIHHNVSISSVCVCSVRCDPCAHVLTLLALSSFPVQFFIDNYSPQENVDVSSILCMHSH